MKYITALCISLTFSLFFTSCNNDDDVTIIENPPLLGQVFEVTVDFTPANGYSSLITYPNNLEVFESDVVLVYLLEDVVPDGQGGSLDVWTPLPQTFFTQDGTLLYTFNHTFFDVNLFLDANFNLDFLNPSFTQNQTFRIAVLPAEFADTTLSMDELLFNLNLQETDLPKL